MPPDTSPRTTLFVTTLSSFLTVFASSSITVALPSIGAALHADAVLLNWIITAFLLTSSAVLIPMGRVADIVGRKRIFVIGVTIYALTGLGSALCRSVWQLIALRAVQGVGGAMIFSTAIAILVSVYPPGERGRVIGINTAAVYVGLSAGPFFGGLLTHAFGWQSVFLINVLAGLVILPLVFARLRGEWREAQRKRFDAVGSTVYAAALVCLLYGFSIVPSGRGVGLAVAGLAGLVLFVLVERRLDAPLLPIALLYQNRAFAFSNLAAMINYSATFAAGFFLSLYLQNVKGMSPSGAGTVLVIQPIVQAALSPLSGKLSDRIEPRILASFGMAASAAGLVLLAFVSQATPSWYVPASLVMLGAGFALFSSPNTNAVLSSVGPGALGVANAMLATMRNVGMTLSMAFALLLLSLFVGRAQISAATAVPFLAALRASFAVFSVLCFVGIFASLARGNVRKTTS